MQYFEISNFEISSNIFSYDMPATLDGNIKKYWSNVGNSLFIYLNFRSKRITYWRTKEIPNQRIPNVPYAQWQKFGIKSSPFKYRIKSRGFRIRTPFKQFWPWPPGSGPWGSSWPPWGVKPQQTQKQIVSFRSIVQTMEMEAEKKVWKVWKNFQV